MAFNPDEYMPIGEAARVLALDTGTVYGEFRRRGLPVVVVNNRRALHRRAVALLQADCAGAAGTKAGYGDGEELVAEGIPEDPLDGYIDVHEAAVRLGIRSTSVHRLIEKKRLPALDFLGKVFIEKGDFAAFAANYDRLPASQPPERSRCQISP